ncbi:MAG: hypothetical protein HFH27_12050 [Clostridiaceae bacterium]|nr:hypothetical protein [Clostridiaceae bacterium]MCI9485171.1 hypothetical protein [Clostridiaceae bacterium]
MKAGRSKYEETRLILKMLFGAVNLAEKYWSCGSRAMAYRQAHKLLFELEEDEEKGEIQP